MTRNVAADYIRVFSILYIIGFWHLQAYGHPVSWIEQKGLPNDLTITALALFVFMSGSFLGSKDLSRPGAVGRFYADRFWSVYLPFLGASGLFVLLKLGDTASLLKGALLVGMLVEPAAMTLWFANMIVLFYLVAPLLIALRRSPVRFAGVCAAILVVLGAVEATTGSIDQRLLLYFPVFAAGIAIDPARIADLRLTLAGLILAIAGLAVVSVDVPDRQYSYQLAPFALGAALALSSVLYRVGRSWTLHGGLEALVAASYFAYLLHRPVYKLTLRALPLTDPWLVTAELLVVGLPLTFVAAWGLQRLYAQATQRIRRYGTAPAALR